MKIQFQLFKTRVILLLFLVFSSAVSGQQTSTDVHEITIYTMPTLKPLNWESPSNLYSSMISCYIKTIGVKNNYLLGHVAVKLKSPLVADGEMLIAQTSGTMKEKRDMIFKEKVGMAIMGASLNGRIEPQETLKEKLRIYAKRKKLAFIKYLVADSAMSRILSFIEQYKTKKTDGHASCDLYGGSFNPRFENEGSGCSAFGLALLDLINLSPANKHEWAYDVNIPIDLIGGKFNHGKKIKTKAIMDKKEWFNPQNGTENVDYVNYFIYDPSLIFQWILNKREANDSIFQIHNESEVPGLYVDARQTKFDNNAPLFLKRQQANLFVDVYLKERFPGNINEEQWLDGDKMEEATDSTTTIY